ncbi:MAG: LysM peptidoglycan-binding domain-containing protein [Ignavibacteriota bacterium]
MTQINSCTTFAPKTLLRILSLFLFIIFLDGCNGSKKITSTQADTSARVARNADVFATLDDQQPIDSAIVEARLEAARQEWLRALAAEQRKDKNEVLKRFEVAIDILNRLIYYPNVNENKDFQELTKSVIEDYEKFVSKIDILPPSASIFALRQKFNEEMSKMDIRNLPIPRASDIGKTEVPLTINPEVEKTIAYFMQGNGRTFFGRWLARSGKFFPRMKQIFREEGTPEELIYLSMIESGMNPTVVSKAQAVGLWQFIQGTGAMYGLKSNWWLDNRRDPWKATRAAARHLKDLHRSMGDWYLALSCYNCSMTRIRRCMSESNDSTFWGIRDCLPKETQNYIPLYVAATLIAMDPARYGFTNIQYETPDTYDTVFVHEAVDLNALGSVSGVSGLEIKALNPELLQPSTPPVEICGPEGYCLRIPSGKVTQFYQRFALLTPEEKRPWLIHSVERGESLKSIARTYGLSTDQLADYNNISSSEHLKRGTRLRVPMSVMAPGAIASNDAPTVTAPKESAPVPSAKQASKVSHRVKRGETLNSIAQHYGVRVSDIRNWNNLSYRNGGIKRGQKLVVYMDRQSKTNENAVAESGGAKKGKWVTYKVQHGDTMAKIADDYSVSLASLAKWNGKSVRHGVKAGQNIKIFTTEGNTNLAETPSAKPRTHAVRPGETMSSIAKTYGTTVEQIAEWNDGLDPASLQAGQKLNLYSTNKTPAKGDTEQTVRKKTSYRVRSGDTLFSIADKYGVSVTNLKKANHLVHNTIPKGKKLIIP